MLTGLLRLHTAIGEANLSKEVWELEHAHKLAVAKFLIFKQVVSCNLQGESECVCDRE